MKTLETKSLTAEICLDFNGNPWPALKPELLDEIRLHNAAPDLLAALEAAVDSMMRAFPNGLPIQYGTACEEQDWDTALQLASAAIAKAKGGAL